MMNHYYYSDYKSHCDWYMVWMLRKAGNAAWLLGSKGPDQAIFWQYIGMPDFQALPPGEYEYQVLADYD
jgi:hypothetical protein